MIKCSSCGNLIQKSLCATIFNFINYCPVCIKKILIIHSFVNDIKVLCPHCKDLDEQCDHCNLDSLLKKIQNDEE